MPNPSGFVPVRYLLPWPDHLARREDGEGGTRVIDRVGITEFDVSDTPSGKSAVRATIACLDELVFQLPGFDGLSLVLGVPDSSAAGTGAEFDVEVELGLPLAARMVDVGIALRFKQELLKPVGRGTDGRWITALAADGSARPFELRLTGVDVGVDGDGDFDISFPQGAPGIAVEPFMIAGSGVVVEADQPIQLYLSRKLAPPPGKASGFRGIHIPHAQIHLPEMSFSSTPVGLEFTDCYIGSGGFEGHVSADLSVSGELFGIGFVLEHVGLTFDQSVPVASDVRGVLALPFFDEPVAIELGLGLGGAISAKLTSTGPDGLYKLTKPGLLEMELDSIGFEVKDGVFLAKLSGQITPLFGRDQGLVWPGFKVEELSIDSRGHVKLQGGWLALRKQYELNLYGFKLSITRLGFGKTEDGGKWAGFSGGLKLVDGFTAGASVEGLRITWYDDGRPTKFTFEGIGVEFEIPEVLTFKGAVSMRDLVVNGQQVRRFDGDIKLKLISLKLEIDAKLVFGSASGGPQGSYNFFAIYLGVELPTGIPLGSLPLSLYGMAGLFALQMEPNKLPDEEWYEDWYLSPTPGVTDLKEKWENRRGSMALGGGVTIGTNDNGFTFACKALLVIVFPGPIILLEGKANLLKERAKLDGAEPLFRSLSVLDMRQGQVLMGLDARYRQDDPGGKVLDVRAGAEAFFATPGNWHLYLGEREPRDKRIRAEIFKLFEANSYFMLDPAKLATGAWVGYARSWQFGPVGLALEAWLEGNVVVNWSPLHFHGDLWLHGLVEVKVFGFGMGLGVDARFEADAFAPFHLLASLHVYVKPPKPLKKKEIDITLEWGPTPTWPTIPSPLKEVAVEHFKVTTSWPLAGHGTLAPPVAGRPVVPLDARPHVGFRRPVHDDALVGVNPQPVQPEHEIIGDPSTGQGPAQVRYALREVQLLRWDAPAQAWRGVAVAGRPPAAGERTLYGSWAPVPGMGQAPLANDKLWLWSRTPFDYTRHGGSDGDDWFVDNFPDYPCVPQDLPDREVCCDFERLDRAGPLASPWRSPEHPEITVDWGRRGTRRPTRLDPPVDGFTRALCLPLDAAPAVETRPVPPVRPVPLAPLHPELAQPLVREADVRESVVREADVRESVVREADVRESVVREAAVRESVVREADVREAALPEPRVALTDIASVPLRGAVPVSIAAPPPAGGITIRLSQPAKRVRVWFITPRPARVCVDFRTRSQRVVPLPLREQGVTLGPAGAITSISPAATTLGDLGGLICAASSRPGTAPEPLDITLPCAAATVELVLSHQPSLTAPARAAITAFNAAGEPVAAREMRNPAGQPEMVRFEGGGVKRVRISTPAGLVFLHQLCFVCAEGGPAVTAAGFDREGRPAGRAESRSGVVEVTGERVWQVRLGGQGELCLLRICATLGPSPREVSRRQEMAKHLQAQVARWRQEGEVLEPFSDYRLRIVTTADAYGRGALSGEQHLTETTCFDFRTEGPPGVARLSVPAGQAPDTFESGLDDLTRYVRQTTPPTVPAPGEKPVMAKPFYRAFDVGVEFNEDYVDLMYRISGRDLGLYLYDASNRPVRDAQGRLLVQGGEWGAVEELTLTEGEERWVALSEGGNGCLPRIDRSTIVHDRKLTSAVAGRVLDPDTLYEARLVPLLLRDFFRGYALGDAAQGPGGRLGRWRVHDAGDTGGPSRWEVRETPAPAARYLAQTSGIRDGGASPADPAMPGAVLVYGPDPALPPGHAEQPAGWTDYRLSAWVRTEGAGALGLVFRYQDGANHYRVSLDCGGGLRRLVRVAGGVHAVLAEGAFACEPGRDVLLTVEAVGSALRVYQDGAPVLDAVDAAHAQGSIGLYAYADPGARFADVRVDDFRRAARPVYRFQLTTSHFANFFHYLHSYQDETWRVALAPADVAGALTAVQRAVPPAAAPGGDEARAYAAVADVVLGPAARTNPPEVQVTRVDVDGKPWALLVRGPEPLDWPRTEISLLRTPYARTEPALPGRVKLTGVRFAAGTARLQSVDVLLREAADLAGYRVESRLAAWPVRPESGVVVDARALAQDAGAAPWTPWHAVGAAGTLPAGTRLHLAADPAPGPPDPHAGLPAHDAGSVDPAWRILFSREVRVVAPDGTVVHARHFLPDAHYAPEDVNVLRKADGTGLFLFMPGAAAFPPAQYRLVLTYHRDNRARVPGSPVWSQAGDTSPELVTLDIPLQTH